MRYSLVSLLIIISLPFITKSQGIWSRAFSTIKSAGQGSVTEVIECPNGDLICAGGNGVKYSEAVAFLMRMDSSGSIIWYKEYEEFHSFSSVIRLESGDLVAGGIANQGMYTSSVLKTDSLGNVIQGVEVEVDYFGNVTSLIKSPNGYIATAAFAWELNNSMTGLNWIARLQPNGGTNDVEAVSDGFVVVGTGGLVSGYNDIHLTKIDYSGNPIWAMCYGGQRGERAMDVEPTTDGGFLIGGWTDSFDAANRKYFLVKTDSLGNYQWGKTYNDPIYGNFGHCVLEDNAGNFYIGGIHQSGNVMIIKTDASGNFIWSKTFQSGTAYSMIQTMDENIVVAGETTTFDYFVFKMDTSGNSICSQDVVIDEYNRPFESETSFASGGIVNYVYQVPVSEQSLTRWYGSCETLGTEDQLSEKNDLKVEIYPNPAQDVVHFKFSQSHPETMIKIFTSQGKLIAEIELENGLEQTTLNLHNISNGIYFYNVTSQNKVWYRGKFLVDK